MSQDRRDGPSAGPRQIAPDLHVMVIGPDDDVEAALDALGRYLGAAGVTCAGGLPVDQCSTDNCTRLACPPADTEVSVVLVEI